MCEVVEWKMKTKVNQHVCERCKQQDYLLGLRAELLTLDKSLNYQREVIENQQRYMKHLLATIPVTPDDLRKRNTLIKLTLWTGLAIFLFVVITASLWLTLSPQPSTPVATTPPPPRSITHGDDVHQLFRRQDWGARPPKRRLNATKPAQMVVVKHTGGRTCTDFQDCAPLLQTLQSMSVRNGYPDIYCSFLVSLDGDVYEGKGWGVQPEQGDGTYDVVFMGNFEIDEPRKGMFRAAQALLEEGMREGYLGEGYKVVCHSQTMITLSPGTSVCEEVKKWSHYDPGMYFGGVLVANSTPTPPPTKPSATPPG